MTHIPQPVQKNTTMWFCSSVPITPDYSQSLSFENQDAQLKYFTRKVKHVLYYQSYQRAFKGTMRVNLPFHELDDCNYIVFQNISSLESYFFAFLDTLTYISTNVTEVSYSIDVMQTYLFSYTVDTAFIERTHIRNDTWFSYMGIEPEPLQNKATITCGAFIIPERPDGVCIMATQTPTGTIVSRNVLGNFSGLSWSWGYSVNNPALINEVINQYQNAGQAGAIQRIFQYPKKFTDFYTSQNEELYQREYKPDVLWSLFPYMAKKNQVYQPQNLKMFSYPYAFVLLDNSQGSTCELRHEYWEGSSGQSAPNNIGQVHEYGVFGPQASAMLLAQNYGNQGDPRLSIANSVSITNFPECAWNEDTYKVWLAQTKATVPYDMTAQYISYMLNVGRGAFTGFVQGGEAGGVAGIINGATAGFTNTLYYLTNLEKQSTYEEMQPAVMHGVSNGLSLAIPMNTYQFLMRIMRLDAINAKKIDNYFTRYGYAQNCLIARSIKTNVRPHWTYVKTVGCNVIGTMPANIANAINRIYDNGITWWNPEDDFEGGVGVGNYGANNRWPEDPPIPDGRNPATLLAINSADENAGYYVGMDGERVVYSNAEKLDGV